MSDSPHDFPTEQELGLEEPLDTRAELEVLLIKFRRIGPLNPGRLTGTVERSDVMRFVALIEQLLNHD